MSLSPCPRCAGAGTDPEHQGACGECDVRALDRSMLERAQRENREVAVFTRAGNMLAVLVVGVGREHAVLSVLGSSELVRLPVAEIDRVVVRDAKPSKDALRRVQDARRRWRAREGAR